jgi:hypothetical protein
MRYNTDIKIERDVLPPPDLHAERYKMPRKWPWHEMKPGDSFVVATIKEARSANNSFKSHQSTKHTKLKPSWTTRWRQQPDGTYRLWLLDTEV